MVDIHWIIVCVFISAIIFVIGINLGISVVETTAIEHQCAYHHPTTGDFTWLLEEIND